MLECTPGRALARRLLQCTVALANRCARQARRRGRRPCNEPTSPPCTLCSGPARCALVATPTFTPPGTRRVSQHAQSNLKPRHCPCAPPRLRRRGRWRAAPWPAPAGLRARRLHRLGRGAPPWWWPPQQQRLPVVAPQVARDPRWRRRRRRRRRQRTRSTCVSPRTSSSGLWRTGPAPSRPSTRCRRHLRRRATPARRTRRRCFWSATGSTATRRSTRAARAPTTRRRTPLCATTRVTRRVTLSSPARHGAARAMLCARW